MIRFTVGFSAMLIFVCAFLVPICQTPGACDNKCRNRSLFIRLGPTGQCWAYETPSCKYCKGAGTQCDTSNRPDGTANLPDGDTCDDQKMLNNLRSVRGCNAACLVPPGMATCEATGMPFGFATPALENIFKCSVPPPPPPPPIIEGT